MLFNKRGGEGLRFLASANLQMDQMRREEFKAALPTCYKGLTSVPDPPTELLFGDLDTRMKDLDEKAKMEDTLQSAPPSKFTKVSVHPGAGKAYVPPTTTRRANSRFPASSSASKNLHRFPTMDNLSTTLGKQPRGRSRTPKGKYFSLHSPCC